MYIENLDNAKRKDMPDWIEPMLAKLTHDHFEGEDWYFERKLDGERVLAFIDGKGNVALYSRNQKMINESYPEIVETLEENCNIPMILDGEVVAFNEDNISDFQKLQPRMHVNDRKESLDSDIEVYYYIFDCPYAQNHDLSECEIQQRKKFLKNNINWTDPLRFCKHWRGNGIEHYKSACKKGWEGLIAKKADSKYVHSRSSKWLKFKCIKQQEFIVVGFTEPEGERKGFGALLIGYYDEGKLVYSGEVGTGFDDEFLQDFRDKLDNIRIDKSPLDRGEPEKKNTHFVEPKYVCEVTFTEWTSSNKLRHPSFKGLRRDKKPEDVHKEDKNQIAEM